MTNPIRAQRVRPPSCHLRKRVVVDSGRGPVQRQQRNLVQSKKRPGRTMAKLRSKIGPVGTACQEVAPGLWRFETNQFHWEWRDVMGLNLSLSDKDAEDERLIPVLFAKNLDHAVLFAQGYDSGFGYAQRVAMKEGK